jgi:hypothetical protein
MAKPPQPLVAGACQIPSRNVDRDPPGQSAAAGGLEGQMPNAVGEGPCINAKSVLPPQAVAVAEAVGTARLPSVAISSCRLWLERSQRSGSPQTGSFHS